MNNIAFTEVSDCFHQTKRGVKRKADTTTSCSVTPAGTSVYSSPLESAATPLSAPSVVGRRDISKPIKRLKKEPAENDGHLRFGANMPAASDAWKLCTNLIRDLMSKKCQVRWQLWSEVHCECDCFSRGNSLS